MLIQRVKNDLRVRVFLYVDNHAHAVTIGFVVNVGNALDAFLLNKLYDIFDKLLLVYLIGKLGNHYAVAGSVGVFFYFATAS